MAGTLLVQALGRLFDLMHMVVEHDRRVAALERATPPQTKDMPGRLLAAIFWNGGQRPVGSMIPFADPAI